MLYIILGSFLGFKVLRFFDSEKLPYNLITSQPYNLINKLFLLEYPSKLCISCFPCVSSCVYLSQVIPQIINNIPTIRQGQILSSCTCLFQRSHAKQPIECGSREAAISPDPHMTALAATVLPLVATPHLAAEVSQQRVVAARPLQMTVIDPDKTCAHSSRQHLCVHIDAHIQRQLINEDCQNLHFCLL